MKVSILFLLCLLTGFAWAEPPAGTVLYYRDGKEVYLLLADHNTRRGWAAFGGGGEAGETVQETAARETEEETRGYFKRADILRRIGAQPAHLNGDFHLYFVEVGYVPVSWIQDHPISEENPYYQERGPYAWIPYTKIQSLFEKRRARMSRSMLPKGRKTRYIWDVWIGQIKRAEAEGVLPWLER